MHKITQIVSSLTIAGLLLMIAVPSALAEEKTSTQSGSNDAFGVQNLIQTVNKEASKAAERNQKSLGEIIKRADTLVTERIGNLNKLLARLGEDTKLTDSEKTTLTTQIQDAINDLNTLKTKIDTDSDATTAMSDAKQIFSNFRIYEVLEPKIRLLIMLNNIQTMLTNLQNLMPQLQNLSNNFSSQGKNTTDLGSLITDINTQIKSLLGTITTDITTVENINVATTDPKNSFGQTRSDIEHTLKPGLQKIKQDVAQMRPIFKSLILPNPNPSKSPEASSSANP